jgi:DNA primase
MDAVAEVKARLNIEDVISEYVALKRAGKNYKGLSPFSNEKTPSFVVSPEKQIWHDFSSGRGGDVFTFVQEVEGLDFKATLELLARKAGVDLEQFKTTGGGGDGKFKERLYEVLESATRFYQAQLPANKKAIDYVVGKRRFNKQTLIDFRLGYSPDGGRALIDYLVGKGYKTDEIKRAGLTSDRRGGLSDMFRGRLMIPLCDQFGKPIGFTARILVDDKQAPKYINTPSTFLYDKSRHVYGLHLAKKAIQTDKFSVLCEGNLDVISSHQAGVKNVVATAGTALTEMQLKTLGRFSPDVRLAFDEDRAGLAATERAIPIAEKTSVNLSVITIPSGKDPDELIKQDPKIWQDIIKKPVYVLDWLVDFYKKQLDVTTAQGKKQFAAVVLPVVERLTSDIEKDHYIGVIAEVLGIEKSAVKNSVQATKNEQKPRLKTIKTEHKIDDKLRLDQKKYGDQLLALCLMLPRYRNYLSELLDEMFLEPDAKELLKFLIDHPEFDGSKDQAKGLNKIKNYVKIATLLFEELYSEVDTVELQYEAVRLRSRLIELYVKDQKQQIVELMESGDEDQITRQLEKVRELNKLLKKTKS